jgi:hypothetical protein
MFSIKSKPTAYMTAGLLGLSLPVYGVYSMRTHLDERMAAVEHELQAVAS